MPGQPAAAHPRPLLLAAGVVALEFAAAVSGLVDSTLLPAVAADLATSDDGEVSSRLALLVTGDTVGLVLALPLARRVAARLGLGRALTLGTAGHISGAVVAATAQSAPVFLAGRFLSGFCAGLLGVFGVALAIESLDETWRARVVAASSAMWMLPSLVGPSIAAGVEAAAGWRWTILAPVPLLVLGRLVVVSGARRRDGAEPQERGPDSRSFLLDVLRARPGAAGACLALTFFATGWFGASSLVSLLLTRGFGADLRVAALAVSAGPLAWAVVAVLAAGRRTSSPVRAPAGLALSAACVAGVVACTVAGGPVPVVVGLWALAGAGIGLAYPPLYVASTRPGAAAVPAVTLATAAVAAEAVGSLTGTGTGALVVGTVGGTAGLAVAYAVFAVVLLLAAALARRFVAAQAPSGPVPADR